jgi:DNA-binding transcriptional LysR family regulator
MTLGLLPQFYNTAALRYFYEVARYGSFKVAEEKIHIAASAIRRQIQLLEDELGTKLFTRNRERLELTPAGESLLYRTKRVMHELAQARSEIAVLQGERTGHVRIGINDTAAREFLTSFLADFQKVYPNVTFEIVVGNSNVLSKILLGGDADIIIGYALKPREGLQQVAAFNLETCITVPKNHRLAAQRSVRIADLEGESFIFPSDDQSLHHTLTAAFARASLKPASNIVANSFELIAEMVAKGLGISCQVRLFVGPDPNRPQIVYVPINDAEIQTTATLGCFIAEDGGSNMATLLCLEEMRVALQKWTAQPEPRTLLEPEISELA